jgi:hypothetical protein
VDLYVEYFQQPQALATFVNDEPVAKANIQSITYDAAHNQWVLWYWA